MYKDLRKKGVSSEFNGRSDSVRDIQFNPHHYFQFIAAFDNGNVQVNTSKRILFSVIKSSFLRQRDRDRMLLVKIDQVVMGKIVILLFCDKKFGSLAQCMNFLFWNMTQRQKKTFLINCNMKNTNIADLQWILFIVFGFNF